MSRDERWIVIPRWDEFQHPDTTRSGVMPWVKNFTRLLSDDAYLDLTYPQRGLLHSIWLEYARSKGQLRVNTADRSSEGRLKTGSTSSEDRMNARTTSVSLSRRLGQTVRVSQLEALNHAGFIQFAASKPASTGASNPASNPASPEERREETPLGVSSSHRSGARATPADAGRAQANGTRPAIDVALDFVRNVGAEIPASDLRSNVRSALTAAQSGQCRADELDDDDWITITELHHDLQEETP